MGLGAEDRAKLGGVRQSPAQQSMSSGYAECQLVPVAPNWGGGSQACEVPGYITSA